MVRLIKFGYPYSSLTEQGRMVPDILSISNALVYHNRITTHEDAELSSRHLAQQFAEYAAQKYLSGRRRIVIYIDIAKDFNSKIEVDNYKSRYNSVFALIAIKVARDLLKMDSSKTASIGLLTGYRAQARLLIKAVNDMLRQGVAGAERLHVFTIHAVQGKQFDFVIVDFLYDRSLGHMQDPQLLAVALTRAMNGAVILATKERAFEGRGARRGTVRNLFGLIENFKVPISSVKHLSNSQSLVPLRQQSPWLSSAKPTFTIIDISDQA
ncbi:hypothetical protein H2198_004390 [Neophaeococcomyces mojaviensis]|uniref:Uncharacterized protein n=1 Tax=Neophaeococcomyces mojaviensis TaxID=3383035 RepID=A0ACC3A8T0_9EURO|nr:hypothetical protein H2198_004390 [Knufia sp. JES_112]